MKSLVSLCPIEEVMRILSGRWPTLLLYYLQDGTKRFSDLQRDNPTVSHRILTLELRKLEMAGIIRRTAFDGYPLRVEYYLTERGWSSCRSSMHLAPGGKGARISPPLAEAPLRVGNWSKPEKYILARRRLKSGRPRPPST